MAGYELATAYINLVSSSDGISSAVAKGFAGAQKTADRSGRSAGKQFANAFSSQKPIDLDGAAKKAAAQVEVAAGRVERARAGEEAAARQVQIAEAKLTELRESGTAKASQLLTAEDKLVRAKNSAELASQRVEKAVEDETAAKVKADRANDELVASQKKAGQAAEQSATKFDSFKSRVKAAFSGNFKEAFAPLPKEADKAADKIEREFDDAGRESGSAFSRGIKTALGAAAAYFSIDAIKSGFQSVMLESGNLEQSIGAIDSVFKDAAGQMHSWASAAAGAVGLSKNEYNELGTLIGAQLKNAGMAMDQLAPKTNELIGLGSDLASMFGGTTREAVEAISSALKGERDPIEKYGVSLRQAAIDSKAAELGFQKVGGSFDQEAQSAATLALIMDQTADAHGNFGREANTLANRQQVAAAQWSNLKSRIGEMFLPALTKAMTYVTNQGLPALEGMIEKLKAFGGWVRDNSAWLIPLGMAIGGVALAFGVFALAQSVATIATTAWGAALNFALGPINWIILGIGLLVAALTWFFTQTELGQKVWATVWGGIKTAAAALVNWFTTYVVPVWNAAMAGIGAVLNWLWASVFKPVFGFIGALIRLWWNGYAKPVFTALVWFWKNAIAPALQWLWNSVFKPIFGFIGTLISFWWNRIVKPAFNALVTFLKVWVFPTLQWLWSGVIKPVFSLAGALISAWWTRVKANFDQVVAFLKRTLGPVFRWLYDNVIKPVFNGIRTTISNVWNNGIKPVFQALGNFIKDKVAPAFKSGVNAIGKAWDGLEEAAKKPVRFVVNTVINEGIIARFNDIAGRFPGTKEMKPLKLPKGFDSGGWTGSGPRLKPAGIVHADEFVVKKSSRQRFERQNPGVLDHINRTGSLPMFGGYASGGRVGTLWDAAQWWIARGARASRHSWFNPGGRRTTSGHSRNSYHYRDLAVDFNYGPGGQNPTEMGFFDRHIGAFHKLFPGIRTIWRAPGHWNHLHIDTAKGANMGAGGGGGGGFELPSLLSPFEKIFDTIKEKAGEFGQFGQIAMGAGKKLVQMPIDWIKSKIDSVMEGAGDIINSAQARTIKELVRPVAATYGWGFGPEWNALDWLVSKESSWDPNAANPRSSARGLFQKMTSLHGPVEKTVIGQARWGLRYIKDTYGTPSAAKRHHVRENWYDKGGLVLPQPQLFDGGGLLHRGINLIEHKKRRPDRVLSDPQWQAIARAAGIGEGGAPDRGGDTWNIYGPDPMDAAREVERIRRKRELLSLAG